jgi:hypothetical protein
MAAWQRGIGNGLQLDKLLPSSREILQIASMAYTQQLLNQDHTCLKPG